MLTAAGTGTVISFFVGWLVLDEPLKVHHTSSGGYYMLAPLYLAGILIGMAGLVFAPHWASDSAGPSESARARVLLPSRAPLGSQDPLTVEADSAPQQPVARRSAWRTIRGVCAGPGYLLAAASGAFASLQYLVVSLAQRHLPAGDPALDPLGSWTLSFSLGALLWTAVAAGGFAARNRCAPVPAWRRRAGLRAVALPGLGAGLCWCAGNLLSTLTVERGGTATTVAQYQASNLITSGAWGLLWYGEFRGRAAALWAVAASFTLAMVLLLALERGR